MTTTVQELFSTIYLLEDIINSSEDVDVEENDIYEALVKIAQDYDEDEDDEDYDDEYDEDDDEEEIDIEPTEIISDNISIDTYNRLFNYCRFLKEFVRELDALGRVQVEFDEYCKMNQYWNYEYAEASIYTLNLYFEEDRIIVYSFCDLFSKESPFNNMQDDEDEEYSYSDLCDYMRDHVEEFEREITETQYEIYCENGYDNNTEIEGYDICNRIVEKYRDAYKADLEAGDIVIPSILL